MWGWVQINNEQVYVWGWVQINNEQVYVWGWVQITNEQVYVWGWVQISSEQVYVWVWVQINNEQVYVCDWVGKREVVVYVGWGYWNNQHSRVRCIKNVLLSMVLLGKYILCLHSTVIVIYTYLTIVITNIFLLFESKGAKSNKTETSDYYNPLCCLTYLLFHFRTLQAVWRIWSSLYTCT